MDFVEGSALDGASRFCFGCEQLGGVDWGEVDVDELLLAVRRARAHGVNFFDTASVYGLGLSEKRLSKALGRQRFDTIVATKGGLTFHRSSEEERAKVVIDASPEVLEATVDESLGRLRLRSLPVFYLHRPDPKTSIESSMNALMSLKKKKKIENIGLSNFSLEQIAAARQFGDIDVVQVEFSLISRDSLPILEWCRNRGIAVCVYGVLAQGLLTGKYSRVSRFSAADRRHRLAHFSIDKIEEYLVVVRKLSELADERGRKPAQIAIRYALQNNGVSAVIVGIKSASQLDECIDVFGWELSADEIAFLES